MFRLYRFLIIATLLAFLSVVSILKDNTPTAKAGALTGVSIALSSATESATSSLTLSLTNETALSAYSGKIQFQMYGPYNWQYSAFNFNSATIDTANSSSSTFYISSYDWSGLTIRNTSAISAGSSITIEIDNITNPSLGGYYYAHVWTGDYWNDLDGTSSASGDYNTAYVEVGDNTNLKGQILDPDGNPVPYTNVYINDSSYTKYYSTYTDKNGNYGFADLTAGSYYFNVYYYGYGTSKSYFSPDQSTVTVAASGVTTKNTSFLAANRTVSGKVTKNSSSGAAVTDANIYAYKSGGGSGWAQTMTDGSGNYSLQIPAGNWVVYVYPIDYSTATWTINNTWEPIDVSSSSKTKDFIVDTLSSTISGSIKKSDGTAMGQWDAYISFSNTKNQWFSAYLSSSANGDGSRSFSAKVTPSTYSVSGSSSVNTYAFPTISNFSVGDGETYNLGTIELTQKTDTISGKVTDNLGGIVAGASVSAWKNIGGYDWGYATTDSSGNYTIYVTPGSWQVSVWGPWSGSGYDYISSGKPTSVTVTSGTPATTNFTLQKATSTITGKILDPDTSNPLSGYGSISAGDGSTDWGNIWGSVNNGVYSLKVPAGTWTVTAQVWHADYSNPDSQQVTIGDNETKTLDFTLLKNNSTISGTVYDENNNVITGKWMSIYANKGNYGNWKSATFDTSTGTYSVKVSSGTWNLGWWMDYSSGYSSGNGQDVEVTVADGETAIKDIILKKVDSVISGTAKDGSGNPIKWAWVTADARDPNKKSSSSMYYYGTGGSSDASGNFTINIPAGTYWVGGNMWYGSGYINPKKQKVTVDANTPATVDLVFRQADATISGSVTRDDTGNGVSAFVSAWSEDGGYSEANSTNDGTYSLSVSSGSIWHIKANYKDANDVYKSKEHIIDLSSTTTDSENIILYKKDYTLPDEITVTFDPSQQQTVNLGDGTTLNIPANSISDTADQVTLTATPDIDLAEQDSAKPVAYGYDFSITDDEGQAIETFESNITIEQTYEESWLGGDEFSTQTLENGNSVTTTSESGGVIDENELFPAYYDTSVSAWKEITNMTVNETQNSVSYQTNHFTKYALVTATDTTPPTAPTSITATAGNAKVTLGWTNPTDSDFSSINIYRSTTSGSIGTKVHSAVSGTSKEDTGLTNGTTYYYTVKAVDASGNESINSTQVSATPSGTASTTTSSTQTLPKTGYDNIFVKIITAIVELIEY